VGHAVVVFLAVFAAVAGQKRLVHLQPDAVGVDKGPVQVKKQHDVSPFSFIQPEPPGGFNVRGL
jgi:hypothetical protein